MEDVITRNSYPQVDARYSQVKAGGISVNEPKIVWNPSPSTDVTWIELKRSIIILEGFLRTAAIRHSGPNSIIKKPILLRVLVEGLYNFKAIPLAEQPTPFGNNLELFHIPIVIVIRGVS